MIQLSHVMPVLLVACAVEELPVEVETDTEVVVVDSDVTEEPCTSVITGLEPGDGSDIVPVDAPIRARFRPAAPADAWSLDLVGVPGSVRLSDDGRIATFEPDEPLEPNTTYTLEATVCDREGGSVFTTGSELVDPTALIGRTWAVPWRQLRWAAPSGANLFAALVQFDAILVELLDVAPGGTDLRMLGTAGYRTGATFRPECFNEAVPGDMDFESNPFFTTGATTFVIPVDATVVPTIITVHEFRFSGTFVDGGDTIEDFNGTGLLDTRGIDVLVAPLDACLVFGLAGSPCVACPDGVPACVWADATAGEAAWSPGSSVTLGCP